MMFTFSSCYLSHSAVVYCKCGFGVSVAVHEVSEFEKQSYEYIGVLKGHHRNDGHHTLTLVHFS